jgi:hypothetical protein
VISSLFQNIYQFGKANHINANGVAHGLVKEAHFLGEEYVLVEKVPYCIIDIVYVE